jgi:hypothetical protein
MCEKPALWYKPSPEGLLANFYAVWKLKADHIPTMKGEKEMRKGLWFLTLAAFLGLASLKSFARRIRSRSGLPAKGMTTNRHTRVASSLALLSVFISGCCQVGNPCENTGWGSFGPSKGEMVGIAAGAVAGTALVVGTVVAANHEHHILEGCVSSGPAGLQLTRDSDKRVFFLVSAPADLQPGEKVKLHGTKRKKQKGSPGNQQFVVEKVTKDFGKCEASLSAATPISAPSR